MTNPLPTKQERVHPYEFALEFQVFFKPAYERVLARNYKTLPTLGH